jgi:hypothetical protein
MDPASHYREAERLLEGQADALQQIHDQGTATAADLHLASMLAAKAHAHATLALAGATFLAANPGMYQTAANDLIDAITGGPTTSEDIDAHIRYTLAQIREHGDEVTR